MFFVPPNCRMRLAAFLGFGAPLTKKTVLRALREESSTLVAGVLNNSASQRICLLTKVAVWRWYVIDTQFPVLDEVVITMGKIECGYCVHGDFEASCSTVAGRFLIVSVMGAWLQFGLNPLCGSEEMLLGCGCYCCLLWNTRFIGPSLLLRL